MDFDKIVSIMFKSSADGKGADTMSKKIKNVEKDAKNANKEVKSLGTSFGNIFKTGAVSLMSGSLAKISKKIIGLAKNSSDYIETLNVLDVAFDNNTKSIREFTSNIAETLNLDDATLIKTAASFKTLANSMGLASENGEGFSKVMTQVTTDVASLYNMDISKAQSMLQYAIQGQGKTLKAVTGASSTEAVTQLALDKLGIDVAVSQLNDYEKAIARTIAITYQLRNSQGDLARTIPSPANQFRVLGEQLTQLSRNIGNVFLPIVAQVLPYLNAVVIVLNRIISSLAKLVGFNEKAWSAFGEDAEGVSTSFDDMAGAISGVGSAAEKTDKKLRGLRGFDKLNVINTPTKAGGAGGGGTGIDPKLLDALSYLTANYKSSLLGLETEATRIANKIMEALSSLDFSNLIDSLGRLKEAFKPFAKNIADGLVFLFKEVLVPIAKWTISDVLPEFIDGLAHVITILNNSIEVFKPAGDWIWKNFLKPLGKWAGGTIVSVLKNINTVLGSIAKNKIISAILVGGTVFTLFATNISKITTLLGATKLGGAISNLLKPTKTLFDYIGTGTKSYGNLKDGIKVATDSWRNQMGITKQVKDEYGNVTTKIDGMKGAVTGAKIALENIAVAAVSLTAVSEGAKQAAKEGLNLGNALGIAVGSLSTIASMTTAGAVFGPLGAAIGFAAGLIGTLVTGFTSYNDELKKANKITPEYEKSLSRLNDAQRDNLEASLAMSDRNTGLVDELGNLVDANGKVKDSDKDRVDFILNELNDAYGENLKLIDGKITKDGEEVKSIKAVQDEIKNKIKWLKLEAVQEAYREDYIQQLKDERKLKEASTKAHEAFGKQQQYIIDKYGEEKLLLYQRGLLDDKVTKERIDNDIKLLKQNKKTMEEIDQKYKETTKNIEDYDNFKTAIISGNYEEAVKLGGKYYDNSKDMADITMEKIKTKANETVNKLGELFKKVPESKNVKVTADTSKAQKDIDKVAKDTTKKVTVDADTSKAQSKIASMFSNIKLGGLSLSSIFGGGKANGGIFSGGMWHDIAQYAGGGLPSTGQLFMAREAGPELVGKIGSSTAVMNNNQIVSSVSAGVYSAVKNAMGGTSGGVFNIYLDENHQLGSYTLDQLKGMAKSNGKPITIS